MRILLSLAVATAVGFTAVAAQAGSVSFSQFFPAGNNIDPNGTPQSFASTDWDGVLQNVTLPKFDSSLGTLSSISMSLYGNVTSFGNIQNTGDTAATISQYTATVSFRVYTPFPAPGDEPPVDELAPFLVKADPLLINVAPQTLAAGGVISFGSPTNINNSATASGPHHRLVRALYRRRHADVPTGRADPDLYQPYGRQPGPFPDHVGPGPRDHHLHLR